MFPLLWELPKLDLAHPEPDPKSIPWEGIGTPSLGTEVSYPKSHSLFDAVLLPAQALSILQ